MVSDGSAKRYWLHKLAAGGLALFLIGAAPVPPPSEPQGAPKATPAPAETKDGGHQNLSKYERESLAVDRIANSIGKRANSIAEVQRIYGFTQLVLGFFGVGFTGVAAFFAWRATHWAKTAAQETKRSADADNENLSVTQAAVEAARADSALQADRFAAQLAESKRAADAAIAANEINLRMSREQLRAHMFVNSASAMIDRDLIPTFRVTISNNGHTPAKRVQVRVSVRTSFNGPGLEGPVISRFLNPMSSGAIEEIEICAEDARLSPEQFSLINSRRIFFIAAIEVGYTDVLGDKHSEPIELWRPGPHEKGVWFEMIAPPHFD